MKNSEGKQRCSSTAMPRMLLLGASLLALGSGCESFGAQADGRAWQNTDSIAVRYYGPHPVHKDNRTAPAAVPSPNGRYFYVTSARGDLACDCIVRTLEVFESQQVRRWVMAVGRQTSPLEPLHTVEMRTGGKKPVGGKFDAIEEVNWNEAGTALEFLGTDAEDHDQIYRLHLPSGMLEALTHDPLSKSNITVSGDVTLYQRAVPLDPPGPEYPIVPVRRNSAGDVVIPLRHPTARLEYVATYRNREPWVLPIDHAGSPQVWISPDSRRAILRDESQSPMPDLSAQGTRIKRARRDERFLLVDFALQQVRPISASSTVFVSRPPAPRVAPQVLWSSDGTYAILVNTPLPAGQTEAAETSADNVHSGRQVLAYHVQSGRWQVLEALTDFTTQIHSVGWLEPGKLLLITHESGGQRTSGTVYALDGDRWAGRSVAASQDLPVRKAASLPDRLVVKLLQSANDPPTLVASVGAHERILSRPDPALAGIWRARVEPLSWRMPDGKTITGGLSLPRSARPGTPLPLVIQAYYYDPDIFLPEGPISSLYALQTLVAQGMAVLAMNIRDLPGFATVREGPEFVERVDAAVEALAQQGTVDPKRVGLIGFSRGGYMTFYAVTHPGRIPIAAAEVADAITSSYPEYLFAMAGGASTRYIENANSSTVWENPKGWQEQDVLFNVHRMEAATLFAYNGPMGRTLDELDAVSIANIGALQATHRPFEYVFFPGAGHVIKLPRQHLAAMNLSVDWMAYWLFGYEDPSAEKAEQYARWRLIRERNEERKSAQRTSTSAQ